MVQKRRGRKPKEVNEALRKDVFKRPDFVDSMPSRGTRAREIAMMAQKIKAMGTDECVIHTLIDFQEKFAVKEVSDVKKVLQYIKTQLKVAYAINKPKIHWDTANGRIYFWRGINK